MSVASRRLLWGAVAAGVAIRLVLLPTPGYVDDIAEFVGWIRHIATNGLEHAYDVRLTFGPVVAGTWWVLGLLDPAFLTAVDGSDVGIRVLVKLPPTLADLGLAAAAWYALRARPGWAAIAAAIILVHPAVWLVSAWWGQYESVFVLLAVLAFVFAVRDRLSIATVLVVASVLTKPQAVPLVLPFAIWVLARSGIADRATPRGEAIARLARAGGAGLAALVLLWLPFLASGGPARYLASIASYQDGLYDVLSLNAWNFWWLVQAVIAGGGLVPDGQAIAGPVTFRMLGYALAAGMLALVAVGLWRRPTPRSLALALTAAALVAFSFLTTMHERYAYAGAVFLVLLVAERRLRWLGLGFGGVFALNLVAAAMVPEPQPVIGIGGLVGAAGSLATVGATLYAVFALLRPPPATEDAAAMSLNAAGTPRGTSAGSAAATSGA